MKNIPTAALVTKDGQFFLAKGFGFEGESEGEVVFNTGMTGYQEALTDPSYAGQIILFSFPHIGNVGINDEDNQSAKIYAKGLVVRNYPTMPSNWRSKEDLFVWLRKNKIIGLSGIDTRALLKQVKAEKGGMYAIIAYNEKGLDLEKFREKAARIEGAEGKDLAIEVTRKKAEEFSSEKEKNSFKVAVMDYGVKQGILNDILNLGCEVKVFPSNTDFVKVAEFNPDGVFLSNGPGDPEATGKYSIPFIRKVLEARIPLFGICLGHQMLALALGAKTAKMKAGHRGENHPVKDLETGKVAVSSQNHGFCVDKDTLPADIRVTHISLFDGSVEGIKSLSYPAFSVQYHPEASPGPRDFSYHFKQFIELMKNAKKN